MKLIFCGLIVIVSLVSCNHKRNENSNSLSKTNDKEILELPINLKQYPDKKMA